MLKTLWLLKEVPVGKIQLPFLAHFLPASVLGVVSAAARADNSGGYIGTQMGRTIDQ
jgi:hypothetical protein